MTPARSLLILSTIIALGLMLWSLFHEGPEADRIFKLGMILNAINLPLIILLNIRAQRKHD